MPVSMPCHSLPKGSAKLNCSSIGGELFLVGWRVDLDGLDLRRDADHMDAVVRAGSVSCTSTAPSVRCELREVVVEEDVVERLAIGRVEVVLACPLTGLELAGGEDVVVVVDWLPASPPGRGARLLAVAAGDGEVRVPADGHRLIFIADVLRGDGGVDGVAGKRDGEVEIGLREPVAAEVAGVNGASDGLAVGGGLRFSRLGLARRGSGRASRAFRRRLLAGKFAGRVRVLPCHWW